MALPVGLAVAWIVRFCHHRRAERARLARIRARIGVWLTPEWAAAALAPDVAAEEPAFRRFDSGSAGHHRGRSA